MKPSTRKLIGSLRSTHTFINNVSGSRERKQRARRMRLVKRYMGSSMLKAAVNSPGNSYASKILKGK